MAKRKSLIKIKPKKYKVGDTVKVDFIVIHPMDTGMRKDKKTGKIIPAHYINDVQFFYNDQLVTKMIVWESVSTNPYFSINMKITGRGVIKVVYKDNQGEVHEKTKKVKPKKG
ncbi:thiosulfate oxidation carrier complex protein SoxZ [Hydrogenimonas thermophila]|uniref:Sulfur-oxidizing protein SoxZ n=1 Tax=Hydrogenimonas thermophila TaxID=223786 RepID=A0A1I5PNQ2_9BACT|nr:thiosulfate oxidation carrier complex protein SoxZ [Hydrogenimonas thermophila]WOE71097.1 thiosulfate oxidation carrier complex protein SoxZ [Hydrogenimonas thermophila]WOE73615.1 thiosulfate oxidation carrier complex protein SoxZ [Hydrogenimonas thermophila]SFP35693.1 sulfur-oxidizing protein SoxZ [Hydrogenimonas thermophila]